MTKRRVVWIGVAVAGVLLTGFPAALVLYPAPDLQTLAERVEVGMTESEVQAVFGRPPDLHVDERARPGYWTVGVEGKGSVAVASVALWSDDRASAQVLFGPDGRVIKKDAGPSHPPSWLRRAAQLLGL
jgi:hypothetical protein